MGSHILSILGLRAPYLGGAGPPHPIDFGAQATVRSYFGGSGPQCLVDFGASGGPAQPKQHLSILSLGAAATSKSFNGACPGTLPSAPGGHPPGEGEGWFPVNFLVSAFDIRKAALKTCLML